MPNLQLSELQYELLKNVNYRPFIQGSVLKEMFPDQKLLFQDSLNHLLDNQLLDFSPVPDEENYRRSQQLLASSKNSSRKKPSDHFSINFYLIITVPGAILLNNYEYFLKEIKSAKDQADSAKTIAQGTSERMDNLKTIANSSESLADSANKLSHRSDIISHISLFVSIFVAFIEFAVNYDAILAFIRQFFQ